MKDDCVCVQSVDDTCWCCVDRTTTSWTMWPCLTPCESNRILPVRPSSLIYTHHYQVTVDIHYSRQGGCPFRTWDRERKRKRGDWKCGSGKCDTVKIARVENAGVEKAGVDSRGGKCRSGKCRSRQQGWKKCRSKPYGTPARDYIEKDLSYFVILVLTLLAE